MHEIAAASRLLLSSSFMQARSRKHLYRQYETPPLPLCVYKKASLSKDRLGLAKSCGILNLSICLSFSFVANILPHISTANLSCPIFFFARYPRFLIFWRSIQKNYIARSEGGVIAFSSLPSCTFILFMQPRLYSYVSFYCFLWERLSLWKQIFQQILMNVAKRI